MTDILPAPYKYWPDYARDKYDEIIAIGRDDSRIGPDDPSPLWLRTAALMAAQWEIHLAKEANQQKAKQ